MAARANLKSGIRHNKNQHTLSIYGTKMHTFSFFLLIILEAMKMENNINADKDGKVTAINVNKGDSVLEGNDLVIIE